MTSTPSNQNDSMNQTDHILEQLRPRMHAARVSHVRRMVGVLAVVPLLGVGAIAMASESDAPTEIETAVETERPEPTPDVELPEIGDADGDVAVDETDADKPEEPVTTTTEVPVTTTTAPDAPQVLEVGVLGKVEVEPTDEGFTVLSANLVDGWEVVESETTDDGSLVIYVSNGDFVKTITVKSGIRDDVLVSVDDWVPPTTTTTTVKPEPRPEEPVVVDRFSVEVPGHGSFIVEREGEKLYVGNVSPAEGHDYDIHESQGWRVYVGFYAEGHAWFGKALINDHGEVELHFWDEPVAAEPVYQWAEIGGVGAAKFEILEGQIRVVKTETAEGFGSWDYNQGAWGETAKVDFEGEAQIWFIDAWVTESGELGWTSYQGG